MTTVTRLKSEVSNKSLPVLLPDGSLSNYYYGKFVNAIEARGYQLSSAEKTAVSAFVESGLNSWIDYVDYLMPFIGDNEHPNAGTVPLIDNIGDYNMSEYGDESYASMFEFDANTGKILSVHNEANLVMRTPLDYTRYRGGCYINCAEYNNSGEDGPYNYFLMTEDVVDSGITYYVRIKFHLSSSSVLYINTSVNGYSDIGRTTTPISYSINNSKNAIIWAGIYKDDSNNVTIRQGYSVPGDKFNKTSITTNPNLSYIDRVYGKLGVGRQMRNAKLKCHAFINPAIPEYLVYKLSDDMNTFVAALGR